MTSGFEKVTINSLVESDLSDVSSEISTRRIHAIAEGLSPEDAFLAYKDLLPEEVQMVDVPYINNINCAGYALDLGRSTSNPFDTITQYYKEVNSANDADIYVLSDNDLGEDFESNWVHVGKILPDGTAESKWGWNEPVFRSPISFYPARYTNLKFYKKI